MKLHRVILVLACLAVLALSVLKSDLRAEDAKAKVLFVSQSAGFRHGSVNRGENELAPAEIAMTQLGSRDVSAADRASQRCCK